MGWRGRWGPARTGQAHCGPLGKEEPLKNVEKPPQSRRQLTLRRNPLTETYAVERLTQGMELWGLGRGRDRPPGPVAGSRLILATARAGEPVSSTSTDRVTMDTDHGGSAWEWSNRGRVAERAAFADLRARQRAALDPSGRNLRSAQAIGERSTPTPGAAKLAGVPGSVGKTTTKETLAACWARSCGSEIGGNLNNEFTGFRCRCCGSRENATGGRAEMGLSRGRQS